MTIALAHDYNASGGRVILTEEMKPIPLPLLCTEFLLYELMSPMLEVTGKLAFVIVVRSTQYGGFG